MALKQRLVWSLVLGSWIWAWLQLGEAPARSGGQTRMGAGGWTVQAYDHCFPPRTRLDFPVPPAGVSAQLIRLSSRHPAQLWKADGQRQLALVRLPDGRWLADRQAYRRAYYGQLLDPGQWLGWLSGQGPLLEKRCQVFTAVWPPGRPRVALLQSLPGPKPGRGDW